MHSEDLQDMLQKAEQRYKELEIVMDDAEAEKLRLQGEYRILKKLLDDDQKQKETPDPATKIEVTEAPDERPEPAQQ